MQSTRTSARGEPGVADAWAGGRRASTALVLAVGLVIAAVLALTVAAQIMMSMPTHGHSFLRLALWQFASWSYWAVLAPLVLRVGARLPGTPWRLRQVTVIAGVGAGLLAIRMVVAALAMVSMQPFMPVETYGFFEALGDRSGVMLLLDVLVGMVLLAIGVAMGAAERAGQLEVRKSRLEVELARANLEALRLEIQPHFLFNTLNTIGALIRRNAGDRALEMLVSFSDLLRDSMEQHRAPLVPLEAEIEFVRKYVDLHRVRFSDRLSVAYVLDPAAASCPVPPFLLQPLVENAFRHGLSARAGACSVEIGTRIESGQLRIWVADDGVGVADTFELERDAGTGLHNVMSRVNALFGADAQVTVRAREPRGALAEIVLPAQASLPRALAAS
jgi:two-component system, LytTR family, sensor kinase